MIFLKFVLNVKSREPQGVDIVISVGIVSMFLITIVHGSIIALEPSNLFLLENFIKNSDELLQQTVYLEIKFEEICHLVTPWNLKQSSLKHAVVY